MISEFYWVILAYTVLLGLVAGSFISAYTWRVHIRQKGRSSNKGKTDKYSLLKGRSMCVNCEHTLAPLDLIPIFSWLLLKGRCRYCKKPISYEYPLLELVALLLFVLSIVFWPSSSSVPELLFFAIWLCFLTNLIALSVYDIKWLTLPNSMVYSLFILAVAKIAFKLGVANEGFHYLLQALLGMLVGGGLFYILYQVSGGKWIGGGDVKLGAILGLYMASGLNSFLMIFISSLIGTFIIIPLMLTRKFNRHSLIPYGPLLIMACFILVLFGSSIDSWLKRLVI